jgi:hypothetical protein
LHPNLDIVAPSVQSKMLFALSGNVAYMGCIDDVHRVVTFGRVPFPELPQSPFKLHTPHSLPLICATRTHIGLAGGQFGAFAMWELQTCKLKVLNAKIKRTVGYHADDRPIKYDIVTGISISTNGSYVSLHFSSSKMSFAVVGTAPSAPLGPLETPTLTESLDSLGSFAGKLKALDASERLSASQVFSMADAGERRSLLLRFPKFNTAKVSATMGAWRVLILQFGGPGGQQLEPILESQKDQFLAAVRSTFFDSGRLPHDDGSHMSISLLDRGKFARQLNDVAINVSIPRVQSRQGRPCDASRDGGTD